MNIFKRIFGKSEENLSLPDVSNEKESFFKEHKNSINEEIINNQERIHSLYPIGMEFKYLGLTMRVVKHNPYLEGNRYYPTIWPGITCRYVNNQGPIEEIFFDYLEVELLGDPK